MKKIILPLLFFPTAATHAATPSTTCPSGYTTINNSAIVIVDGASCPSGYTAIGTANTCLVTSPDGQCMMFIPANTEYTDATGKYVYSQICPLS